MNVFFFRIFLKIKKTKHLNNINFNKFDLDIKFFKIKNNHLLI